MQPALFLPHVNAALNALAGVLLIIGYVFIRQGNVRAHRNTMLSSFAVSVIFLLSYLAYHFIFKEGVSTKFPSYPPMGVRYAYYAVLLSHTLLAMLVPFLAPRTIWLGLKGEKERHRVWAKWTWPIWLYVSVTGVIVYVMLYHLYPPGD